MRVTWKHVSSLSVTCSLPLLRGHRRVGSHHVHRGRGGASECRGCGTCEESEEERRRFRPLLTVLAPPRAAGRSRGRSLTSAAQRQGLALLTRARRCPSGMLEDGSPGAQRLAACSVPQETDKAPLRHVHPHGASRSAVREPLPCPHLQSGRCCSPCPADTPCCTSTCASPSPSPTDGTVTWDISTVHLKTRHKQREPWRRPSQTPASDAGILRTYAFMGTCWAFLHLLTCADFGTEK